MLTLITAFFGFHLKYTRISGSALIALLFKQCGPEDHNDLCDYNRWVAVGNCGRRSCFAIGIVMGGGGGGGDGRRLVVLGLAGLSTDHSLLN